MADESVGVKKKYFMFWNSEKNIPDVVLLETKDLQHFLSDNTKVIVSEFPLNMRSEIIQSLYKARLNYTLLVTKYQHPLQSQWQYELITAEQYLERREIVS